MLSLVYIPFFTDRNHLRDWHPWRPGTTAARWHTSPNLWAPFSLDKMSDFKFGSSNSGSMDSTQKAQLLEQVKAQVAVANAQELLQVSTKCRHFHHELLCVVVHVLMCSAGNEPSFDEFDSPELALKRSPRQKMSDKCFKKCIAKPGTQLENSEQVRIRWPNARQKLCVQLAGHSLERF